MNMNDLNVVQPSRREFLSSAVKTLASLTIVGFVAPTLIESCGSSNPVGTGSGADAGKTISVSVASLTTVNSALHTTAPVSGRELLVVRTGSTTYETLLLVCPHAGCSYPSVDQSGSGIICTCHGSTFDINGNRLSGPAQTGLTTFTTAFNASTNQ